MFEKKVEELRSDMKLYSLIFAYAAFTSGMLLLHALVDEAKDPEKATTILRTGIGIITPAAAAAGYGLFRYAKKSVDEIVEAHSDIDGSFRSI